MLCPFCKNNINEIDVKKTNFLKKYISGLGKIKMRKKTQLCAKHQKKISRAIKQARHLGLLSAVEK